MRKEILVASVVVKYRPTGQCVIKGRYCDASANVGIRGCYPLSLINDDVLATQLQLPPRHLALSSTPSASSFSFRLSLCPPLFLSRSRGLAATLERSNPVEADARPEPPHPIYTILFHPRFSPPPVWSTSCPLSSSSTQLSRGIYSSRTSRTTYNARYTLNSIPRNLRPLFRSHR